MNPHRPQLKLVHLFQCPLPGPGMCVQGLGPEGGTAALSSLNDIFFVASEAFLLSKGLVATRGLIW